MKIISTLLLLFAMQIYCYSQKTAPVAGHAARLVDLLKKDYSSVDIASRNETILKDMEEVLATFKVYAGNDYNQDKIDSRNITLKDNSSINAPSITYLDNTKPLFDASKKYIEAASKYNNISKTLASVDVSSNNTDTVSSPYKILKKLNEDVETEKKAYEEQKLKNNSNQLLLLHSYFKESNPYLSFMLELFIFKYDQVKSFRQDVYSKVNYTSSIQKALPFFGGDLAFKEAIDGLSKFLAKRIKDELTTYAVQKVQEYLNNPKPESYLNELMVLLPVTTSYLKSFDSTRTLNFVNDLKQYIEQDLNNLMSNAINLKNTPRFKSYLKMHPDLDFAFEALELIPQIQKLENPIDYFDILENSRNIQRLGNIDLENQESIINDKKTKFIELLLKPEGYKKLEKNKAEAKEDFTRKEEKYINAKNALDNFEKLPAYKHINEEYRKINEKYNSAKSALSSSTENYVNNPGEETANKLLKAKTNFKINEQKFDSIKIEYRKIPLLYLNDKPAYINSITIAQDSLQKYKADMAKAEKTTEEANATFSQMENELLNLYLNKDLKDLENNSTFPKGKQLELQQALNEYKFSLEFPKKSDILKYNIVNSIKFASMIAHSLVVVENNKPRFASTAFVSAYSSEVNFYLLYLGFLNQQNKKFYNVSYYLDSEKKTLEKGLENLMENIIKPKTANASEKKYKLITANMVQIATNAERLNTSFNDIKKANSAKEKVTAEQVHALTNDMIDFAEGVVRTIDTLVIDKDLKLFDSPFIKTTVNTTKPYFITAHTVNDIFLDLHTKSYTTALIKAIEIPLAFGKDNSQSEIYNSIMSAVNRTGDIQQMYNLKKIFSYDRIYTDVEKYKNQKETALWLEISLKDNLKLEKQHTAYKGMYDVINNKNQDSIIAKKKEFRKSITNDSINFYKEYAGIDTNKILKDIDTLLTKHNITDAALKSSFKSNIENIITKSIREYVFNDIDNKKELEEAKEMMIQNFKYYMPEVFPDVFEFKDENTIKMIHFVNDIANAENSEDVEKALNTFALPPGSSSLKEHTYSYYSINSYPGLFGGITLSEFNGSDVTYTAGITAPVGFYAQPWPAGEKVTWGIYVPIIDIAAPVRLRFNSNNDTEVLPDFDFMDIFSPGLYFTLGFNKSPFALNFGGQFGPRLKAISSDTTASGGSNPPQITNEKQVFYFGIGAVIDIPLFTLFAKSKK
ncbi:hypothetical protein ABXT06_05175 [Flavobacterium sp. UW10123]|uniref:hypothetical protein n=1 Tax=Flavobacterium sp. UW10123 TaxID=3230800 RepID=UPI003392DEF4